MEEKFPDHLTGKLRACMGCTQIKTLHAFKKEGCENCEEFRMRGNPGNVTDTTSNKFSGFIGMAQPEKSWVAKWQRINKCKKGMYALTVEGSLPDEFIVLMEQKGKTYVPRDESFKLE